MTTIKEMASIEYELDFESLQMLERDFLRLEDSKLPPIKNMSGSRNDLKKLISHMKSINEDGFLKKYGRIAEITKVSMHNSTVKDLMHF
jgi:hypothetical protein